MPQDRLPFLQVRLEDLQGTHGMIKAVLPETPSAILASIRILARHRALFGGKGTAMAETEVARVIQVFERVGAGWVLVGAHAVGMLTEPRATADFDFIVEESKLCLVLEGLREAFGELDEEDVGAAVRLRALNVDLIRSTNHPLFGEAIAQSRKVDDWNVPSAEVIVVLKYLSAVSPWRHIDRRAQDIVDLRRVYRKIGRDNLDVDRMVGLAALAYPGAENEFRRLLERIDRGQPIEV